MDGNAKAMNYLRRAFADDVAVIGDVLKVDLRMVS
jgi:hypothetical protein